jgi:hypothetical protein
MLRRALRPAMLTSATALLGAGALAGCGGGSDDATAPVEPPVARASDFPAAKGQTIAQLTQGLPQGPTLTPSVSVVKKGPNRLGFALFDRGRKQITGASVAIYIATANGTGVRGPYPARSESLAVKPQFVARTTSQDPDAAKSVYVADVPLRKNGLQAIIALARLDGRLVASSAAPIGRWEGYPSQPPEVGEKAIRVSTPTEQSVGGDLAKVDTRVPPDTQHDVDFAAVLGKRPVVLTFATPQLCQSRVCGPVVDVAEQVKSTWSKRGVAFIHMEIYANNEISNPPRFRPQVAKWRLPSEPWTFVIGKDGRVKARFEGAESVGELERAVQQAVGNS